MIMTMTMMIMMSKQVDWPWCVLMT